MHADGQTQTDKQTDGLVTIRRTTTGRSSNHQRQTDICLSFERLNSWTVWTWQQTPLLLSSYNFADKSSQKCNCDFSPTCLSQNDTRHYRKSQKYQWPWTTLKVNPAITNLSKYSILEIKRVWLRLPPKRNETVCVCCRFNCRILKDNSRLQTVTFARQVVYLSQTSHDREMVSTEMEPGHGSSGHRVINFDRVGSPGQVLPGRVGYRVS